MKTIIVTMVPLVKNLLRLIVLLWLKKLWWIWPKTLGELRTLEPRTLGRSNFLGGTRTLRRPALLGWSSTLKGKKTLTGPRIQERPKALAWPRQLTDKPKLFCKTSYYIKLRLNFWKCWKIIIYQPYVGWIEVKTYSPINFLFVQIQQF